MIALLALAAALPARAQETLTPLPDFCVAGGTVAATCRQLRECAGLRRRQLMRDYSSQCTNPATSILSRAPACGEPGPIPDGALLGSADGICNPVCGSFDTGPGSGELWQRAVRSDGQYCMRPRRNSAIDAIAPGAQMHGHEADARRNTRAIWSTWRGTQEARTTGWITRLTSWRRTSGATADLEPARTATDAVLRAWGDVRGANEPDPAKLTALRSALDQWKTAVDALQPVPDALSGLRSAFETSSSETMVRGLEELAMVQDCRALVAQEAVLSRQASVICPVEPAQPDPQSCGENPTPVVP